MIKNNKIELKKFICVSCLSHTYWHYPIFFKLLLNSFNITVKLDLTYDRVRVRSTTFRKKNILFHRFRLHTNLVLNVRLLDFYDFFM